MLKVWSDDMGAGYLDRSDRGHGSVFAYEMAADEARAVSLSMPKRLASYEQAFGLHPIFEMNLPEGALRERLRLAFAKATGHFDDLDLLSVTGRSQLGRLRYTARDGDLDEDVPFQSVDEILARRRDGSLFSYLLERFAAHSGVSGIQPKILIRDEADSAILKESKEHPSTSFRGATHIVKFWNPAEYPQLAANEFFCLRAAERCGLDVPRFRLAEDGAALVLDRFDLRADGTYRGMEDFCVLNGLSTARKYHGGYEKAVFRRLKDYMVGDIEAWRRDAGRLFTLFVLNCAVRNGDAHLKNFAVVYDDVRATPRLSPVYDVVTTTVYLPEDRMALTLNARPLWPEARHLDQLGTTRCALAPAEAAAVRERVADALSETLAEMAAYAAEHSGFAEVADRMAAVWQEGIRTSLGSGIRHVSPAG